MIIIYCTVIFLILIFALFNGKNILFHSFGLFQISSCIIIISLLIYNILTSTSYSAHSDILEKTAYFFILNLKIHISDVVVLYNIGNFMLLISCIFSMILSSKKMMFCKSLLFIPPVVYFIANHPRFKYFIWNYAMVNNLPNPIEKLIIINSILLIFYFFIALVSIIVQYIQTRILSKKKYAKYTFLYVFIVELTIGIVLFINQYSNYYPLRNDINSLPSGINTHSQFVYSVFSASSKYIELIISFAIIILLYIFMHSDFSFSFVPNTRKTSHTENVANDKTLKTIFHSYKNTFFAIERFSIILDSAVDKSNDAAVKALSNIKNISHNSYEQLCQMLDSVILSYDFTNKKEYLQLDILLYDILLQFKSIKGITVEDVFIDDAVYISGNSSALSEAFINILNNAVEATANKESPFIRIELFVEDNLAVINFYDNGCGVEKSNIRKIFKPLYSSKNSNNNFGIGLSTALKTIHYHSGSIVCKSKPDKYTVFQVTLPIVKYKK